MGDEQPKRVLEGQFAVTRIEEDPECAGGTTSRKTPDYYKWEIDRGWLGVGSDGEESWVIVPLDCSTTSRKEEKNS